MNVIASDRRERGNPVLLLETWGLDRHVPRIKCGVLAMTILAPYPTIFAISPKAFLRPERRAGSASQLRSKTSF